MAKTATPPAAPPAIAPVGGELGTGTGVAAGCAPGRTLPVGVVVEDIVEVLEAVEAVLVALLATVLPRKAAAALGFDDRKAAVRSPSGHPLAAHGLDLQHPMKGGFVALQVYQRLPDGHDWSAKVP